MFPYLSLLVHQFFLSLFTVLTKPNTMRGAKAYFLNEKKIAEAALES
jgi:hypothetical protein